MTPSPSSSPFRTPPQVNSQCNEPVFIQPAIRAQENLIFAIKNMSEDEFDRYLDQALQDGASLNSVDDDGLYPLELAVIEQRPRIVQSLLTRDALLPVVADDGFDLVMLAANQGTCSDADCIDRYRIHDERCQGQPRAHGASLRRDGRSPASRHGPA